MERLLVPQKYNNTLRSLTKQPPGKSEKGTRGAINRARSYRLRACRQESINADRASRCLAASLASHIDRSSPRPAGLSPSLTRSSYVY